MWMYIHSRGCIPCNQDLSHKTPLSVVYTFTKAILNCFPSIWTGFVANDSKLKRKKSTCMKHYSICCSKESNQVLCSFVNTQDLLTHHPGQSVSQESRPPIWWLQYQLTMGYAWTWQTSVKKPEIHLLSYLPKKFSFKSHWIQVK